MRSKSHASIIALVALALVSCSKSPESASTPTTQTGLIAPNLDDPAQQKPKLKDPKPFDGNPFNQAEDSKKRVSLIDVKVISTLSSDDLNAILKTHGIDSVVKAALSAALVKLVYKTTDAQGKATQASGLLAVPIQGTLQFKSLNLVSYQHGTVFSKEQVPSRASDEAKLVTALVAGTGQALVAPDYVGLGDSPGVHPYLHAATEGSATVDLIKAAVEYLNEQKVELSGKLFLTGYSQGGHATLAAHQSIEKSPVAPLKLTATAAAAGPYDLSGTMVAEAMNPRNIGQSTRITGFVAYLLIGWNPIYHFVSDLRDILQDQVAAKIEKAVTQGNLSSILSTDLPSKMNEVIRVDRLAGLMMSASSPLTTALEQNDVYDFKPIAPILFLHSEADEIVTKKNTDVAYARIKQLGGTVEYQPITNLQGKAQGHVASAPFAGIAALKWFNKISPQND